MTTETLDSTLLTDPDAPFKQYIPASTGKRFINFLIDTIAFYILAIFLFAAYDIITGDTAVSTLTSYAITIVSMFLYFVPLESYQGKTLGKLVTKTRVITEGGQKASTKTIFGRTAGRLIPFDALTFLGNSGMHDRVSKTIVVDETKVVSSY